MSSNSSILQKPRKSLSLVKSKQVCKAILDDRSLLSSCSQISPVSNAAVDPQPEVPLVPESSVAIQENAPVDLQEVLKEILPPNYIHTIVSVEPMAPYHKQKYNESQMLVAVLRVNLRTRDEALEWLDDFESSSFTDWRTRRNFKEDTKCIIFKKGFRCHNNTLAQYRTETKESHAKHTECDASLMITVKNFKMERSKDPHLKVYPTEIVINHCHNHPLKAADSLRHRRPRQEVAQKFIDFFCRGYSPSAALQAHKYDLQVISGNYFLKF